MKVYVIQRKDDGLYFTWEGATYWEDRLYKATFFGDYRDAVDYVKDYLDSDYTYVVRDYTLTYSGVCYPIDKDDE